MQQNARTESTKRASRRSYTPHATLLFLIQAPLLRPASTHRLTTMAGPLPRNDSASALAPQQAGGALAHQCYTQPLPELGFLGALLPSDATCISDDVGAMNSRTAGWRGARAQGGCHAVPAAGRSAVLAAPGSGGPLGPPLAPRTSGSLGGLAERARNARRRRGRRSPWAPARRSATLLPSSGRPCSWCVGGRKIHGRSSCTLILLLQAGTEHGEESSCSRALTLLAPAPACAAGGGGGAAGDPPRGGAAPAAARGQAPARGVARGAEPAGERPCCFFSPGPGLPSMSQRTARPHAASK